jgi:outer membrane receptor protein involved in Fe transport
MRKSVWLLSAGLFAISAPAHAQQAPETDTDQTSARATEGATAEAAAVDLQAVEQQPTDTSDIVVTATRRNEALSDVPLAVSAVTAETLEYTGASDIRQLNQVSPSLLVSSTSSEAGAGVARIRGIGTVGDNPGLESSVAVFIDGVYRSRTGVGLTELGPLDRIEVLRGPQGTLFGRNASAGLISVITAKPRFETLMAGEVTVGNYDLRRLEGSLNAPFSDTIAARLDGVYMKRDGFLRDVISGRDVNDRNRYLLRGQMLFQPSDDLSVRLIGDLAKRDEECCAAPYLPASDFTAAGEQPSSIAALERGLGAVISDDPFERDVSISPGRSYRQDVRDHGLSGEVVYDFGGAELTSISAYRFNKYIRGQDADFNNLDILFRDDDGSAFNRFKTFTQELRLQGEAFGGRLDWLTGGYYADEKLGVDDNLGYGDDYARYANCLVAANFATATGQAALVSPTNPTCFNPAVAAGVLPFLPVAQRPVLSAFARLGTFAAPVFGNSGFANLATAFGAPGLNLNGEAIADSYRQSSRNFALFTHNIFKVTDAVNLTLGLRYTRERKRLDAELTDSNTLCTFFAGGALASLQTLPCVSPSIPGGSLEIDDKKREARLSGTGVISFKPTDNVLTYASYSRGYKAGGFNLDRSALRRSNGNGAICLTAAQAGCGGIAASGEDLKFKPETNDAFELGAKYNGRGFDVNVALFHQSFKNFQLNTFNGLNFVVENINSCSDDLEDADEDNDLTTGACDGKLEPGVRSRGIEVEVFTRPMSDLSLNGGLTLADTRYRNNLVGAGGRPLTNALFQLPGRRVSNSAALALTGSAAWTPRIGGSGLRGLLYADFRHQSRINTGSDLDIEKVQDGFTVVNGRIGIHGADQAWAVELWGQNLFNKNFIQVAFDAPVQGSGTRRGVEAGFYPRSTQLFGAFLGEPRTFGLTLRGKLGGRRAAAPEPVYTAPPPPPPPVIEQPAPPPPPPPPPPAPSGERG